MNKIKILFVVEDFYQAGAERFCYEVDNAIDRNKFQVEILCLEKISELNKDWNVRYYESLHKENGTKIKYIDEFLVNQSSSFLIRVFNKITRNKFKKIKPKYNLAFSLFFDMFDVIHWMGEYTFVHSLPIRIRKKSLICTMTAKFQDANIYSKYDFEYPYNFMSGFKEGEIEHEFGQFKKIKHFFFPLVMHVSQRNRHWFYKETKIYKIGIFTRLNFYKPLDPFFYSFQLLLEILPNCELHVYGNGDPEKQGMINSLKRIGLQDKVFFRGHQESIFKTAIIEHINLAWFQGYNNDRPAGYAGFDICSTGTPLICWDFFDKPNDFFNETYPHYKSLTKFVNKSVEILTNEKDANSLSEIQFQDILMTRDITKHIRDLENKYLLISNVE
ncbi:hypothetical protein FLAN108750_07170 [Flavobacterium antarcticum]|uniref:hypothetical protein n=1 Tax=Flavobacterium antarcticum TaxID=271155 RepID=UPI0003B4B816|nr:hypothetical protein [Flavobacterium antarcticum]